MEWFGSWACGLNALPSALAVGIAGAEHHLEKVDREGYVIPVRVIVMLVMVCLLLIGCSDRRAATALCE